MPKFITGKELSDTVDDIIWEAKEELLIVSPYIKLGDYFKKLFAKHQSNHKLHITILFGKNENRIDKSLNREDLSFFLEFPNITIVYVPKLHAKYYANESLGVVTSINLYDFSFKENIEFGIQYIRKLHGLKVMNSDSEVWEKSIEIANENEVVYVKRPVTDKGFLGLGKNYLHSKVLLDRTEELYKGTPLTRGSKRFRDFDKHLTSNSSADERPTREEVVTQPSVVYKESKPIAEETFKPGYCIRTGEKIPFNVKAPFSKEAYQSWNRYKREDFAEKFCHYSGEPSNGETSFKKPILAKNWKKANA